MKNSNEPQFGATRIAVIGLGYVGLPLAAAFAEQYPVIGHDINPLRIEHLRSGTDLTLQVDEKTLKNVVVDDAENVGLFLSAGVGTVTM